MINIITGQLSGGIYINESAKKALLRILRTKFVDDLLWIKDQIVQIASL